MCVSMCVCVKVKIFFSLPFLFSGLSTKMLTKNICFNVVVLKL